MDSQIPPTQNPSAKKPTQEAPPPTPKSSLSSKIILIIATLVLVLGAGGTYLVLNSKKENPKSTVSQTPTPAPFLNGAPSADIFRKGFYINRDLKFSFNYPVSWSLGEKTIDRKGNLNNLAFYLGDLKQYGLEDPKFLTISVTKGDGESFSDSVLQFPGLKKETKKIGDLNGDFYSVIIEGRSSYWAVFIATLNNLKYGFVLSVSLEKKEEYLAKFEELISSVQINDSMASSLPEYFRDNLTMDRRISQPSYLPNRFSITYEEQESSNQEWKYSWDVTERSSGPNNLNIDVQKIGSQQTSGSRKFIANLESLLEEKSINQPGIKKGDARVEPIEVKGFKGYYINIGPSPENSYGSLIYATDKVVVSLDYLEFVDLRVFYKEELLKIAESMIHR